MTTGRDLIKSLRSLANADWARQRGLVPQTGNWDAPGRWVKEEDQQVQEPQSQQAWTSEDEALFDRFNADVGKFTGEDFAIPEETKIESIPGLQEWLLHMAFVGKGLAQTKSHIEAHGNGWDEGGTWTAGHQAILDAKLEGVEESRKEIFSLIAEKEKTVSPRNYEFMQRLTMPGDLASASEETRQKFMTAAKYIPTIDLLRIKVIHLDSGNAKGDPDATKGVVGTFSNGSMHIWEGAKYKTIVHETGHGSHGNPMTFPGGWASLVALYDLALMTSSGFPSEYSKSNPAEFYAECYSTWLMDPVGMTKRNPNMVTLLKKVQANKWSTKYRQHDDIADSVDEYLSEMSLAVVEEEGEIFEDPVEVGEFDPSLPDAIEEGEKLLKSLRNLADAAWAKEHGLIPQTGNWDAPGRWVTPEDVEVTEHPATGEPRVDVSTPFQPVLSALGQAAADGNFFPSMVDNRAVEDAMRKGMEAFVGSEDSHNPITSTYDTRGEVKSSVVSGIVNTIMDNPELREMWAFSGYQDEDNLAFVTAQINDLIHTWAETSSDKHSGAIALQLAAVDEFGLDAAKLDHMKTKGNVENKAFTVAEGDYAYRGDRLRNFLRLQYNETQKWLSDAGIENLTLFRGSMLDSRKLREAGLFRVEERDDIEKGIAEVHTQPISSFSYNISTALEFAGDMLADSIVNVVSVPKEQILSTPFTGFGCLSEGEVTVLGGEAIGLFLHSEVIKGRVRSEDPVAFHEGAANNPYRQSSVIIDELEFIVRDLSDELSDVSH